MRKKKGKLASDGSSESESNGSYIGYAGAEFSEEEITHPQAFGGSYLESNVDLTKFVEKLESNGFTFAQKVNLNPSGKHVTDFEFLHGFQKWNHAPNAPAHIRGFVLMREKRGGRLSIHDYTDIWDRDEWLSVAVEVINGQGFAVGDEQ